MRIPAVGLSRASTKLLAPDNADVSWSIAPRLSYLFLAIFLLIGVKRAAYGIGRKSIKGDGRIGCDGPEVRCCPCIGKGHAGNRGVGRFDIAVSTGCTRTAARDRLGRCAVKGHRP